MNKTVGFITGLVVLIAGIIQTNIGNLNLDAGTTTWVNFGLVILLAVSNYVGLWFSSKSS